MSRMGNKEESFKEYVDKLYEEATHFTDLESERIAKEINLQLHLEGKEPMMIAEIKEPLPKRYSRSQIGQAKANLKRALRAGKQLEKKQKAKRRKNEVTQ